MIRAALLLFVLAATAAGAETETADAREIVRVTEFGGIESGIPGRELSTSAGVFLQLAWYF